jgi:hypothetical protein
MFENILNHKSTIVILLLVLIAGLWFFKDKINLNKKKVVINEDKNKVLEFDKEKNHFIQSDTFNGVKEGYVFKTNNLGIGYYLDK